MFTKNNGSDEHDILQNQFTAFLTVAVSNARIDYLRARIRRLQRELVTEEYEILFSEDHNYIEALSDNDALRHAMREIKEKERYVILARPILLFPNGKVQCTVGTVLRLYIPNRNQSYA